MNATLKYLALSIGTAAASASFGRMLLRGHGVIFMLHRFTDPDLGVTGHDPRAVRDALAHLRREGRELISLEEMLRRSAEPDAPALAGSVAFTIDDGYADHASVGAPLFAEFDCPVTTFLTTGFLDGSTWGWWDQIAHVLDATTKTRVRVPFADGVVEHQVADAASRATARDAIVNRCKGLAWRDVHQAVTGLAQDADVMLPVLPPLRYAPMTWDDARRCERGGMTFGAHTVSHPILSHVDDMRAAREIVGSWQRVVRELSRPVPIFCYPNGQTGDFGAREIAMLRRAAFRGAVTGIPGYVPAQRDAEHERDVAFMLPRFAWPPDVAGVARVTSGLERVNEILRG